MLERDVARLEVVDACIFEHNSLYICHHQVEETDEARKKFTNAKSISSAQYFGVQNRAGDLEASATLEKFSVSHIPYVSSYLCYIHIF